VGKELKKDRGNIKKDTVSSVRRFCGGSSQRTLREKKIRGGDKVRAALH